MSGEAGVSLARATTTRCAFSAGRGRKRKSRTSLENQMGSLRPRRRGLSADFGCVSRTDGACSLDDDNCDEAQHRAASQLDGCDSKHVS